MQETIEKHLNTGKNGTRSNYTASSSSQSQLVEDSEDDNWSDLAREKACSKAPVGYCQLQGQLQAEAINHNLENHVQNLNVGDENTDSGIDDRIPPRFRKTQWSKNFKKQSNKPWIKQQKEGDNNSKSKMETGWGVGQADKVVRYAQKPTSSSSGTRQNQTASSDPWKDWEASVVVHGPIDDDDLEEIVLVDDNDNLDDVMVQQYVNSLHEENSNGSKETGPASSKVTPSRIQELGNLKSTTNADCYKVPPGTIPNPPKGPDRWGGSELKDISEPTGWGDVVEDTGNWYDDGTSMLWGAPSLPYGPSGGWSWNS